ncbi:nitrous oxide reductase accessory protein NosL [Desertivirga arenae]|uniref:nitrous oxide reductase accessory protein NosL n=1 Tax=Desertivirga arenae TaxID=2810309 RepID=UPI001A95A6D7|nr:nitrous oxide reductase accessory protein NosL [Pedobacter sp. SYSU D00823]
MKISNLLIICLFLFSCSRKPEEIHFGTDACDHCKMTIMDQKYGAEIVTAKGKVLKFDSAECMVDFLHIGNEELNNPKTIYLTINTAAPGQLIETSTVSFLKDKNFKSPMGGNLASFPSRQLAENNKQSADAQIMTWDELLKSR